MIIMLMMMILISMITKKLEFRAPEIIVVGLSEDGDGDGDVGDGHYEDRQKPGQHEEVHKVQQFLRLKSISL